MKEFNPYKIFNKLILGLALLLLSSGCGKLDNLDAEDFDIFGDNEKRDITELRHYNETPMSDAPLVEFLVDGTVKDSRDYEKHIRKTCDYTKMPYRATDINSWNTAISPTTRVICVFDTKKLTQVGIDKMVDFVANGGTLFIPFASDDKRAGFLTGFKPDAEYDTDITSRGFLFTTPMLPGLKGQTHNNDVLHYGFSKTNFTKNIRILATSVNHPDFPLIVQNNIGRGKTIFFNTSMDFEKIDRGLMFSAILKGLEGIPYPIANTSTIFLDDFPSPVYDIKTEPVKSEFDMTTADFVKKVWWPDMLSIAKKYNISYSAMVCFDYKNKVDPPFLFDQWDSHKIKANKKTEILSDWLVQSVMKNGHELAFHGYNHVELAHKLWHNPEFTGTAFKAVQKKWEVSNFGPMPITYVPPSDIIDREGLTLLSDGMPSLKFMCSVYLGETAEGSNREFDYDPYNPKLFDYPRNTDGFYIDQDKKYSLESLYIISGIWTHFVHPDDIYQIDDPMNKSKGNFDLRNPDNLGWYKTKGKNIGMYTEFDKLLKSMAQTYPQQRYVNAGEGGAIVNDWRASKFRHSNGQGQYTVEETDNEKSLSDKQYWFMYGSYENAEKLELQIQNDGAQYSKTPYMEGFLYSIYTNKPKLVLRDLQYKGPTEINAVKNVVKKAQGDYKRYIANVAKYNAGGYVEEWVDDSDKKFKQELADLKNKMLSEPKIDSVTWNKYAKYMTWEDKGADVWKLLEAHCVKYPTPQNIMYSKELNKIIEYPNDLTREKWMSAQMLVTPNDKDLLNSYIASYYTPENQEKIRVALVNLLKVDTSFDTYLTYLKHLLTYDPPAALVELKDKKPSDEFKSVASDVAWLYANDGQFQKAYDWSLLGEDVDFASKMSWLIELKSYKVLEAEYKKYIVKNPDDYKAKAAMSGVYHDTDRFRDSWIIANSLPETPEKAELRATLNKDVIYVDAALQQDLLDNHSELFLPEVKDQLTKSYRKEFGDFIALNSSAESNKNDPSAFKNVLSYNFYDSKKNLHGIGATYSTMYKIDYKTKDKDDVTHAIGGIQYQFNNPKSEKWQYWGKARVEYSDYQRFYYLLGMGVNTSKNKNYKSAEFKIFPAETGPAYSKRIYRMQLNVYEDFYLMKFINASVSLEGNYYTPSKDNTIVKTSDTYEGSITTKFILDNGVEKKSKFLPFLEGSLSQASIGKSTVSTTTGYPFWMIDERLYGGGGLGWKYGLTDSNLTTRLEAAWFFDDYSKNFQRYLGEVAYQLFDYTQVTASFEIYAQSKFYSNVVQFGVRYNLKKHKKK